MKTYKFSMQKLVRDKVIDQIEEEGGVVEAYEIEDKIEFLDAITQKIVEELEEVFSCKGKEDLIEELADLEEVFTTFKELVNVKQSEIDAARAKKLKEKGGFENRIFLETMEVEKGSRLYKHCMANPNKYPEATDEDENE